MTTNPAGENLSLLPALSPAQENTKEYKVIIDGKVDSTSSVKSFKWLATQEQMDKAEHFAEEFIEQAELEAQEQAKHQSKFKGKKK